MSEAVILAVAAALGVFAFVLYFNSARNRLSIRAASWLAAQCVRDFGNRHCPGDKDLEAFCQFLEEVAWAEDLPKWDSKDRELAITGLGYPLPDKLSEVGGLFELVDSAREVSASQMYGAYEPAEVSQFLGRAISISGFDLNSHINMEALRSHRPGVSGWGDPVPKSEIENWSKES